MLSVENSPFGWGLVCAYPPAAGMETGMTMVMSRRQALAGSLLALPALSTRPATAQDQGQIERLIAGVIRPVMAANAIPGMAVAVTVQGRRSHFYDGLASKESGQRVGADTLFEIGSVSKTFTATLGAYAEARGALSLADMASKYQPALAGSAFDRISLLDLATYSAGGLPLQFPAGVNDQAQMIAYFKTWRPAFAAGTKRAYSNPSIGLFGDLVARAMGKPFDDLMEKELFPALGLARAYIRVPRDQMGHYASGYTSDNRPARVMPGLLASPAYGVKTSAAGLIGFVEANIAAARLDATLQRAIATTQTGYYQVGEMLQGLGWESYAYPAPLDRLLAGNSTGMVYNPNPATRLAPPRPYGANVLVNKTGSTNGFGAYVAFVPAKAIGIAMLANRNYPVPARLKAAHQILAALAG
jgi:beta-lactamase class C